MDLFFEVLADALLDTARMLPFLFGAYLLMEFLEQGRLERFHRLLAGSPLSPVAGGLLGMLPQCGFSAAAANLYNRAAISGGTLLAVFIATSDEALPIMLSEPGSYPLLIKLIVIKLVLGVGCGLLYDLIATRRALSAPERDPCEVCVLQDEASEAHGHHHGHGEDGHHHSVVLPALRHTLSIAVFIFIVTFGLGGAIALAGQETIAALLMSGSALQPLVAGVVGFIPNCAASVVLTQLLLDGTLSLGSAVAGLTTAAGAGLLVLVRGSRDKKKLLRLLGLLYAIGVVAGMVIDFIF